jgi:hypothetical protein
MVIGKTNGMSRAAQRSWIVSMVICVDPNLLDLSVRVFLIGFLPFVVVSRRANDLKEKLS